MLLPFPLVCAYSLCSTFSSVYWRSSFLLLLLLRLSLALAPAKAIVVPSFSVLYWVYLSIILWKPFSNGREREWERKSAKKCASCCCLILNWPEKQLFQCISVHFDSIYSINKNGGNRRCVVCACVFEFCECVLLWILLDKQVFV